MAGYIEIVKWERYQHYKDRDPTWIKLYNSLLDDYEMMSLPVAERWLAVGLMLLASRTENRIPANPAFLVNRLWLDGPPDLRGLVSAGFIRLSQDASKMLAERYQDASTEKRREETEERRERVLKHTGEPVVEKDTNGLIGEAVAGVTLPEQPSPHAVLMPLTRELFYASDGKPPPGHTERRDGQIVKKFLRSGVSVDTLEAAARGAAYARDHGLEGLKPGEKLTWKRLAWHDPDIDPMEQLSKFAHLWRKQEGARP